MAIRVTELGGPGASVLDTELSVSKVTTKQLSQRHWKMFIHSTTPGRSGLHPGFCRVRVSGKK